MNDNQKKLNEQLVKVVLDTKTCDEVRIKRAKYLIRLGADANQKVNGKSLLKIAREKGYKEMENVIKESLLKSFEKLLDGDKFEIVLDECRYANGHKVVVSKEKAIDLGRQFRDKNRNLKSAKEIEVLIQQGADVNIKNKDGNTALIIASEKGSLDLVNILLEGGADVQQKDGRGWTALMWASSCRNKEIVEMLISKGADINAKSQEGNTALMFASKRGENEIAKMLLEGGADVNVQNKYGSTALMKALYLGHEGVVKTIEEYIKKTEKKANNVDIQKTEEKANNVDIPKTEEKVNNGGGFWGKIFGGFGR